MIFDEFNSFLKNKKAFIVSNFGSRFRNNPKKNGEFIHMEGANIFNFTLSEIPRAINEFLKKIILILKKLVTLFFIKQMNILLKTLMSRYQKLIDLI